MRRDVSSYLPTSTGLPPGLRTFVMRQGREGREPLVDKARHRSGAESISGER
jgi:hypothetical protein